MALEKTIEAIMTFYKKPPKHGYFVPMSQLGTPCERKLWVAFRWLKKDTITPALQRIFNDGFRIEAEVLDELKRIYPDAVTHDEEGKQIFVKGEGILAHLVGAQDVEFPTGTLDNPSEPTTCDVKSAKNDKWVKMSEGGVASVAPEYLDQLILYMGYRGTKRGFLIVRNKDNAKLYTEWVEFSQERFELLKKRASMIIGRPIPPRKRFEGRGWGSPCKFCHQYRVCHGLELAEVSCRTCKFSEPVSGGFWRCNLHKKPLNKAAQEAACASHRYIDDLLAPFEVIAQEHDAMLLYHPVAKQEVAYGGVDGVTSHELFERFRDEQL